MMPPRSSTSPVRRRRRVLPLRRGYSLAALFVLMATIAVLAAMASSVPSWQKVAWNVAIPNLVVGFLGGALLGGTIGIHYERRARSMIAGIFVGAAAGLIGGALSFADFNPFMALLQCAVLVALAVLVRLTTPLRPRLNVLNVPAVAEVDDSWTLRLAQVNRIRLLAAIFMAGCTVISVMYLVRGVQATSSGMVLVAGSLSATLFLLWAAFRTNRATPPEPTRNSPWD